MCVWIIIILQIYHMTDLTVSVYACTMYIQWSGVWRRKKCHENVRFHTTINKYFMLALLSFFLSLSFFSTSSFLTLSRSSHRTHLHLQANEYTALFQNLKHLLCTEYATYAMGSNWKWAKKAHNQVCRYPLRLRRGSNFVGGCCCCWC